MLKYAFLSRRRGENRKELSLVRAKDPENIYSRLYLSRLLMSPGDELEDERARSDRKVSVKSMTNRYSRRAAPGISLVRRKKKQQAQKHGPETRLLEAEQCATGRAYAAKINR
jgi:hypothetical protein